MPEWIGVSLVISDGRFTCVLPDGVQVRLNVIDVDTVGLTTCELRGDVT